MARNVCNCIYFHIQERPVNVLFCMLANGMYWDLMVIGGHWTCLKPVADKQIKLYRDNDCAYNARLFSGIVIQMKGAPTVKNRTI